MHTLPVPDFDPVNALISCLNSRPHLVDHASATPSLKITFVASKNEAKLLSTPPAFTTRHEEISWLSLVARIKQAMQTCAALGEAWNLPLFGLSVTLTRRKRGHSVTADACWLPESNGLKRFSEQPKTAEAHASFLERAAWLSKGPQGGTPWLVRGHVREKHTIIHAADPIEATKAYSLLAHAMLPDTQGGILEAPVSVEEVVHHDPLRSYATPFQNANLTQGEAFDDIFSLIKTAQRSAREAVRRWGFGESDDFCTAVLEAKTVFSKQEGIAKRTVHTPERITTAWQRDCEGEGFDEAFAAEAKANLQAFAIAMMGLPGLIGTPTAMDLYINAIPGGDVLIGMGLAPKEWHETDPKPTSHFAPEAQWGGFCKDWKPRIAALINLPAPTHLYRVTPNLWTKDDRIVSAACPDSAITAACLLWHGTKPMRIERVSRLTTLHQLGLTTADLEAFPCS